MRNFLNKKGIKHETTALYTPEQNGRAERDMWTIIESAHSIIIAKDISKYLRKLYSADYILNRTATTQTPNITPFELWTGRKSSLSHLRVFDSTTYMHVLKQFRDTVSLKSKQMILVITTNFRIMISLRQSSKRLKYQDMLFKGLHTLRNFEKTHFSFFAYSKNLKSSEYPLQVSKWFLENC